MIVDEIDEAKAELRCHRAKLAAAELRPGATRALPRLGRRSMQMVLRLLAYNAELWLSERLNAYLADPDEIRAITNRHEEVTFDGPNIPWVWLEVAWFADPYPR